MNNEERLHRLELLAGHTGKRMSALRLVVSCLVSTHPDKAALAKELRRVTESTTVQHLNDELVTDEVREFIQQDIGEFISIAEQQTKPAG